MKAIKSKLVVAAVAGVVGLSSLGVVGMVSADDSSTGRESLISKLAEKFGVSQDEVQSVFDENREEMQAEREAEASERLQGLVDDGTITAEQKTAIEAKKDEMQTARENQKTELEAWADEQGVDLHLLRGGIKHDDDGDNDRLQQLVDDGEITAEQKSAIEAKREELKTQKEEQKAAFETWAEEQGIDLDEVKLGFGKGGRGGKHGGQRR